MPIPPVDPFPPKDLGDIEVGGHSTLTRSSPNGECQNGTSAVRLKADNAIINQAAPADSARTVLLPLVASYNATRGCCSTVQIIEHHCLVLSQEALEGKWLPFCRCVGSNVPSILFSHSPFLPDQKLGLPSRRSQATPRAGRNANGLEVEQQPCQHVLDVCGFDLFVVIYLRLH